MLIFLLSLVVWASAAPQSCSWNTCNEWSADPNIINVHIVPHTHDDLGWIKTVDQYFFGSKPELVPVGVQYIYNTVIDEVAKSPERRFSFAETGFLTRWTSTHTDAERHKLQRLVKTGQIEMIGGGWVQHDEAAAHYVDIIDQMELGLHHLDRLFGDCGHAQTAWQIDPFGHSRETANLFALMGYSSLFFARVHYLEKEARLKNKSLEFVWNASDDLKTKILTGAFYQDNYGPPPGFCFDALCGDDPIIEFEDMEGYNLPEKLALFEAHVKKQATFQRTKHVMLLMGSDFQYTNANAWYTNLDKLIQHVNANSSLGLRLFYSTPTCYVKGLTEAQPQLTTKDDDFFPYASSNHSFWTGYFTSRPAFKGMIREASALLQLVRQLNVLAAEGIEGDHEVERMQRASALAQHHDAVTGTAKENVTRDYERRLAAGMKDGEAVLHDALAHLSSKKDVNATLPQQMRCELRNETVCDPIRNLATFTVTVFNPRGHTMKEIIRIPYFSRNAVVLDGKKQPVESQITKTFQSQLQPVQPRAPFELSFPVKVSPLGFATYFVSNVTSNRATRVTHPIKTPLIKNDEDLFIENKLIRVDFDKSGLVSTLLDKTSNVTYPLKQEFLYYEGYDVKNEQTSGAYVFRPKDNTEKRPATAAKIEFSKGSLTQEARQVFNQWISQVVRVSENSKDVEFTWTVGPLPAEANITKDFITRYSFGVKSGSVFYTDSNGRQMMKRTRNAHPSFAYENTEPIAANYYPITTAALLRDDTTQATVLTDRAQGASSPADGVLDIMVHRRSFYDDHWGVEEPLNEPGIDGRGLIVSGTHVVQVGSVKGASERARIGQHEVFHYPELTFAAFDGNVDEYMKNFETSFAGLRSDLPPHAHLLTLGKWTGKKIILRLEHMFQISEDDTISTPVSVDLRTLFSNINVTAKREVLLAGIREPANERKDYADDFLISLHPMEIRTFILDTE